MVRVQPRLILLGRTQRASLVPDRAGDPYSAEIVQISRNAQGLHVLAQAKHPASSGRKITNSGRVAVQPGTFEVNEVSESSCHLGEAALLNAAYRFRLGVENRLVRVNLIKIAKQLIGSFDE